MFDPLSEEFDALIQHLRGEKSHFQLIMNIKIKGIIFCFAVRRELLFRTFTSKHVQEKYFNALIAEDYVSKVDFL